MPEKFPKAEQKKPKKKEDFDLDFEDITADLLDLAGELQEGIADGERIIKKYNGETEEEDNLNKQSETETTAERLKRIEKLKLQRGKAEDEEQKKAEQIERQKKAELIVHKIFSSPILFKEIFKNKGKIDHEFLNNLIKINFKDKNKIEDDTENDSLAVEVEVNQMPSLGNEKQKEEFIEQVAKTAEEEFLKTISNIEDQSLLSLDEQEYDIFVKLKLPQEIISGLENFTNTIETTGIITPKMIEKISLLLDYFRKDIKFQVSYSLSNAIEKYFSVHKEEKLFKQYQEELKDKFTKLMDVSYKTNYNFLNTVKGYLETISKKEKMEGKKETISENRLIKNLVFNLENLTK